MYLRMLIFNYNVVCYRFQRCMVLQIHFPRGDSDMYVEFFTPDNSTTRIKLCSVTVVSVGIDLTGITKQGLQEAVTFQAKESGNEELVSVVLRNVSSFIS